MDTEWDIVWFVCYDLQIFISKLTPFSCYYIEASYYKYHDPFCTSRIWILDFHVKFTDESSLVAWLDADVFI